MDEHCKQQLRQDLLKMIERSKFHIKLHIIVYLIKLVLFALASYFLPSFALVFIVPMVIITCYAHTAEVFGNYQSMKNCEDSLTGDLS